MTEAASNIALAQEAQIEQSSAGESARARAARLLDKSIFIALVAILALAAVLYGSTDAPWWIAALECAVFALMSLWIVEGLLTGAWLVREHRLLIPLLALIIFAFVQTLPLWSASATKGIEGGVSWAVSADPYETRLFVLKLLALASAGALLLRYTSNRRRLRALIYLVIGVGVASALFGIVRQVTQINEWRLNLQVPGVGPVSLLLYPWSGVGYGQFINRNHFALLMEMVLGLALGLAVGGGLRRGRQLVYLGIAALVWTALVLTNSRGAVFSMLGQLLFVALLFTTVRSPGKASKQRRGTPSWWWRIGTSLMTRAALIACLVVATVMSVVWVGGDPLISRLESLPKEFGAGGPDERMGTSRREIWQGTWQLIKANPVAGVGFGAYQTAIPQYYNASGKWTPQEAHNEYLELLASGGLIGAALGAWFMIALIKQARDRLRSTDLFRRAACFGALTGLFGVALHSLVDFGLHITVNALIFTVLVVIATIDGRIEKKRSLKRRRGAPALPVT